MSVKGALETRGYSPSVRASFAFRVRDELFAANHATWKVSIADGRANVSKGGDAEPASAFPREGSSRLRCDPEADGYSPDGRERAQWPGFRLGRCACDALGDVSVTRKASQ